MKQDDIIQNYRLIRQLGEGGMGTVWLAQHVSIDRQVAIKVLHPQYVRHESLRARFRNEAKTLAKLQHPNIVTFYDLIEESDRVCMVMEYVQGRNLDEVIRKDTGPLPMGRLSGVFRQILLAFDHAHRAGIVHRDIKPSNFMLTDNWQVKVLDFGIAKLLDDDQHLTRTGTRMGTTFYMSPEQVNGSRVDHRSDIYSLGVTLHVLATGKNPYEGETVEFKVYNRIVHEPLPLARSIYPGVPESVERMIVKATAKDPAHRFQTCGDFIVGAGLENAMAATGNRGAVLPLSQFKELHTFAIVAIIASILLFWVPLRGNSAHLGSLPGLGLLAAVTIFVAAIGLLRGRRWSTLVMRGSLMIYGLGALLAIFFPSTRSHSTYQSWQTINGVTRYSSSTFDNGIWLFIPCALAVAFAAWGLKTMFSQKNKPYFKGLQ